MKKSIIAIPALLALLGAGISTQAMAQLEVEDVVVPVATGEDSTAVGVNDTLNDNKVLNDEVKGGAAANDKSIALNDNEFKDIGNTDVDIDKSFKLDKETDIDIDKSFKIEKETKIDTDTTVETKTKLVHSDFNAVATNGGYAKVDKSFHVKIEDINVNNNTLTTTVEGKVESNYLSFGKDLEQKSYGNEADAENKSFSANKSYQKADSDQYSKSYQKNYQDQYQDSDQDIKQFQANKAAALNASLQAEKSEQDNKALGVNVPVGVNYDGAETQTATATASAADAGPDFEQEQKQDQDALTFQANKSDDPTNKAYGKNDSDQNADAETESKQDQANIALAGEKSNQDQDQDAENELEQDNKANVANKAALANITTQQAIADAGSYTSFQKQTVSLTTGDNSLSGFSMNGVNAIAQNTGVQSFNQIAQNVQLNLNK